MPPAQLARTGDAARVHPATAGNLVADANRSAAQPRQQGRARASMKIDRDVVSRRLEAASERDVGQQAAQPAHTWRDDDVAEVGVVEDHRRGGGLDDIGELRVRKPPAQRVNGWRREHHVADLSQPNQQYSQLPDYPITRLRNSDSVDYSILTVSLTVRSSLRR